MGSSRASTAREFAALIQEALNVLGPAKVTISAGTAVGVYGLIVNGDSGLTRGGLRLGVRMTYQVVTDQDDWSIWTLGYQYTVSRVERGLPREVVAYHWNDEQHPHAHFQGSREHYPTSRILVEDVIGFCVEELGWRPTGEDWREVLLATRGHFQVHRRWD